VRISRKDAKTQENYSDKSSLWLRDFA